MSIPKVVAQLPVAPVMRTGGALAPIVPQTWQDAVSMAGALVRAEMVPKHFLGSVEKTTVAILAGLEVGLPPITAVQSIYIINNMPCLFGDGLIGVVRGSGLLEDIEEHMEFDDKGLPMLSVCRVKRKGEKTWTEHTLTRAQAQRAGWWAKSGPWTQTPQRMMQLRPRSWCLRDKFADVLKGLHSAEEVEDMVDVTPRGSATVAEPEPRRADFQPPAPTDATPAEAPPAATPAPAESPPDAQQSVAPEEMVFQTYDRIGEWFAFSDPWLQDPARTPAEARAWHAFYEVYITEKKKHPRKDVTDGVDDTLALYNAVLGKEQPA